MSLSLTIRNRPKTRPVDTRLLRKIAKATLAELLGVLDCELCLHLVAAPEMARINQQFLQHEGSTDVITFDHSTPDPKPQTQDANLRGEIFICIDDAVTQARQFHTTWQSEIVRYLIHGLLHLLGHDDLKPAARRKMKRAENRLLHRLEKQFSFSKLAQ